MEKPTTFRANGKFLLSSEYFVLKGARALALPLNYGQTLTVRQVEKSSPTLIWEAREMGFTWFKAEFDLRDASIREATDEKVALRLQQLFSDSFLGKDGNSYECIVDADFPIRWGLGTSSTLVVLLSRWLGKNPFQMQFSVFGGSGYDIACAQAEQPIVYTLKNNMPEWKPVSFAPAFHPELLFVYSGRKMDSREAIGKFQVPESEMPQLIEEFSGYTQNMLDAESVDELAYWCRKHETRLAPFLGVKTLQEEVFPDFEGTLKSLGGWGGDFFLAIGNPETTRNYFKEKGLDTLIPYQNIVKFSPDYANS